MSIESSVYLTPTFRSASEYEQAGKLAFLANLSKSPFFKPENDNVFRDLTVFCVNASEQQPHDFAGKLEVPHSLLDQWMQGKHIPSTRARFMYAQDMIEIALQENGSTGYPAMPNFGYIPNAS